MPIPVTYDYAVIRVVPRVEREEFVNVGVIVSCPTSGLLEAGIELDPARVRALDPQLDALCATSRNLVAHYRAELTDLDDSTLGAALREASNGQVAELKPGGPDSIVDLLVATGLAASKGAARRNVAEGGVYVNNTRIESDEWIPQHSDFLNERWLVLRRGKRHIAGVERAGA